jgi:hypothetical protein
LLACTTKLNICFVPLAHHQAESHQQFDLEDSRILDALRDPKWDFRTINGLATELQIPPKRIELVMQKHAGSIRRSLVPDRSGEPLYTMRTPHMTPQERLALLRIFVTKSII